MAPTPLDISVASAVAQVVRSFKPSGHGSISGLEFERVVFDAISEVHSWHHAGGPDQFDMSLPITSRTGVRYEFDGVFASADALYLIEAKHFTGENLAREHVGIFVQKLLDTLLGSYDEIGHYAIKPIIASALPNVDAAALRHAVAWGILLLTPADVTPLDILDALAGYSGADRALGYLARECAELTMHLWRPFNDIIRPAEAGGSAFSFHADRICDASQVVRLLEQCDECRVSAESLHLSISQVASHVAKQGR